MQSAGKCIDFGELELKWPITMNPEKILTGIASGIKSFYRIAYLLYRAEYLVQHSRQSRIKNSI
jgi:hypothetical protein